MDISKRLIEKIEKIKLILTDIDGVLCTRKVIYIGNEEVKEFSALDGVGKHILDDIGIEVGIISGRASEALLHRARELKINIKHFGIKDKTVPYEYVLETLGLSDEEVCYIGDDIQDICLLERVGLAIVPNDVSKIIRTYADYVTVANGGEGVLREVAEMIQNIINR